MPFLFVNCSDAQTSTNEASTEKTEAKEKENISESLLIDVRTPGEYEQGTAGDAINIPVNELGGRLSELPSDKNTKITVFCYSGGRSSRAKSILEGNGYVNVVNGGTVEKVKEQIAK